MQPASISPVKTTTMPRTDSMAYVRAYVRRSAFGHDGLWILADWILADRILADRSFANRRRRRRRLLTRQVGGGGSAQHGQGCSRSEYNALHHDLFPLCLDSIAFRKPRRRSNRRGTPPSSHHHLARAVSTAARLTML